MTPVKALTTREVYQQLRDAAMGTRSLKLIGTSSGFGLQQVEIDGWLLTLEVTEGSPARPAVGHVAVRWVGKARSKAGCALIR
ncbi:hypothetical protein ALP11_01693 [Pseudomonas syringae pv. papulans]|nr:hypothetical protein ALP11_01693 [Pseudomonas syringae pv. papulans]